MGISKSSIPVMENLGSNIRDAKRDDKHRAIICRTEKLQTVKQDSDKKKQCKISVPAGVSVISACETHYSQKIHSNYQQ